MVGALAKSAARAIGSQVGREIVRGVSDQAESAEQVMVELKFEALNEARFLFLDTEEPEAVPATPSTPEADPVASVAPAESPLAVSRTAMTTFAPWAPRSICANVRASR